ncbi:sensor domain-containing diguanylate cyclase [Pontibacillus marinus]|uniref:GGDEF domain-containing protein n=1 Tax=Pontibacillus marinus BH030004 = DSM 16465 TaxID=1385511 RepID=A0A0A5I7N3_9BACI|nr:diguanylate cyclase [Pontibacillus marinus]KGX91847.1 hypothetical protein N783_00055 [Pontibacillus marinus BH030004 = DSM 16465]
MRVLKYITFFILLLVMQGCNSVDAPEITNGKLALHSWDIEQDGKLLLNGEWEFYWNVTDPSHISESPELLKVPATWNTSDSFHPMGYGLYHLSITGLEKGQRYGLKIPSLSTAYKLWVNNKVFLVNGQPGISKKLEKPSSKPQEVFFEASRSTVDIHVLISNFHYREGGMWESLTLGTESQILTTSNRKLIFESFLFGSLILAGLYHIVLFINRKKERKALLFGITCLFISARIMVIGEHLILEFLPHLPWAMIIRIEYLTFYIVLPLFTWFFHLLYPEEVHPRFCKVLTSIGAVFVLVVLFTSPYIFTHTTLAYQIITIITLLYLLFAVFKAVRNKRDSSIIVFICSIFFAATVINDVLMVNQMIQSVNLSGMGLFVFIFSQSYIIAKSFSKAFYNAEKYSNELTKLNAQLEEKIDQRTKSLQESKAELQRMNETLKEMSYQDQLTKLPNRRFFDEIFLEEWNRSLETNRLVAIYYFDIDHFKAYNDTYGHQQGDDTLEQVGKQLGKTIQGYGGTLARMGGEEFIGLTTNNSKKEIAEIAEETRIQVMNLGIEHVTSKTKPVVTVSVGVASSLATRSHNHRDLIKKADEALYYSKNDGKNKVSIYTMHDQ